MTRCAVCLKPFKTKTEKGNVVLDDPSAVFFYDYDRKKDLVRHIDCKQDDFITKAKAEAAAALKEANKP